MIQNSDIEKEGAGGRKESLKQKEEKYHKKIYRKI
jgi:hypothetical protein